MMGACASICLTNLLVMLAAAYPHRLDTPSQCLSKHQRAQIDNTTKYKQTIVSGSWNSAILINSIAQIILREIMGIDSELLIVGNSSLEVARFVFSCSIDSSQAICPQWPVCTFEVWPPQSVMDILFQNQNILTAAENGYVGSHHIYINRAVNKELTSRTGGRPFTFHRVLQTLAATHPWFTGNSSLFSHKRDLKLSPVTSCCGSRQQRGFWCDPEGWFYPDVCNGSQQMRDLCIPTLVPPSAGAITCKLVADFNVPLAVRVEEFPYEAVLTNQTAAFYWWQPDSASLGHQTHPDLSHFVFPPTSSYGLPDVTLWKLSASSLKQTLLLWRFFWKLEVTMQDMDRMMQSVGIIDHSLTSARIFEEACKWVKLNINGWQHFNRSNLMRSCNLSMHTFDPTLGCICRVGSFAPRDRANLSCELCQTGKFNIVSGQPCYGCVRGRYSDLRGATECTLCQSGRYSNQTQATSCTTCPATLTTKYAGETDITACICAPGMHYMNDQCRCCNVGLQCPGGFAPHARNATFDSTPHIRKGYMAVMGAGELCMFKCSHASRCPQRFAFNTLTGKLDMTNMCLQGEGPACSMCPSGRSQAGEVCKPCRGLFTSPALAVIIFQLSICCVCAQQFYNSMFPPNVLTLAMGTIISFVQAVLVQCSLRITYPDAILKLRLLSSIFQFEVDSVGVPMGCTFGETFLFRHLFQLALPLLIGIGFLLLFGFDRLVVNRLKHNFGEGVSPKEVLPQWGWLIWLMKKAESSTRETIPLSQRFMWFWPIMWDDIINVIFRSQNALFIGLTKITLALFSSETQTCGITTFTKYPGQLVDENSPAVRGAWIGSVVGFLLFSLGFFSTVVFLVVVAPHRFPKQSRFRRRFRCLWSKFHPTSWWFCVVSLLYGLLLNLAAVIAMSGRSQLFSAITVHFVYLLVACHCVPWKFMVNHVLDLITKIGLLALAVEMVVNLHDVTPVDDRWLNIFLVITIVFPLVLVICIMMMFWFRRNVTKIQSFRARCHFADRFRNIIKIVGSMDFTELRQYAFRLLDRDVVHLNCALDILMATVLGIQSQSFWCWRCMDKPFVELSEGMLEGERIARGVWSSDDYRVVARRFLEALAQYRHDNFNGGRKDNNTSSALRIAGGDVNSVARDVFNMINLRNDDNIDKAEFVEVFTNIISPKFGLTAEDLMHVYQTVDIDGDEKLTVVEIAHALNGIAVPKRPIWQDDAVFKQQLDHAKSHDYKQEEFWDTFDHREIEESPVQAVPQRSEENVCSL